MRFIIGAETDNAAALELAKEYKMDDWVRALLDPTEIVQSQSSAKKQITPPPKFELPALDAPSLPSSRTRSRRSASPSKKAVSPRKPRQTRAMKEFGTPGTNAANESLQSSLDITASTMESPSVNGTLASSVEVDVEAKTPTGEKQKRKTASKSKKTADTPAENGDKKVKAEEESDFDVEKEVKPSKAAVSEDVPVTLPEGPSAEDTEDMIAKAKETVQEAAKGQEKENVPAESPSAKASKKRKTDKLSEDEEDEEALTQRKKRARVLEDKLKQERVRNRALFGVTAAFALA